MTLLGVVGGKFLSQSLDGSPNLAVIVKLLLNLLHAVQDCGVVLVQQLSDGLLLHV